MKKAAVLIMSVVFILTGCASVTELSVTDDTKSITAINGEKFDITIPAQISTGYKWVLTTGYTLFTTDGKDSIITEGKGSDGTWDLQVIHCHGIKSGSENIELKYLQPWKKDVPAVVKTMKIELIVKDK